MHVGHCIQQLSDPRHTDLFVPLLGHHATDSPNVHNSSVKNSKKDVHHIRPGLYRNPEFIFDSVARRRKERQTKKFPPTKLIGLLNAQYT